MEIKGTHMDYQRFEEMQKERWEHTVGTIFKCKVHNTLFDTEVEPCWPCYDECEEEEDEE